MKTIQWGIIGCGDVTEVKSGPAFNKVPDSKLVAVMRRDGAKAADYARRHGVPKWYADASKLIDDPDVNAVYVATPPDSHEAYTLAAIAAGKHVYVEKPMTVSAASAKRMLAAAVDSGIKLCVAHYRKAQPRFRKLKALLEQGAIGEPRLVNLQLVQPPVKASPENWRLDPKQSGGGLFHDLSPHQLDLLQYFFGTPEHVTGVAINQGGFYAADDLVAGSIRFSSGAVANVSWCFTGPMNFSRDLVEIYGSKGRISFSVFSTHHFEISNQDGDHKIAFDELPHVQQPMIEQVVQYFRGNAPNPSSAYDAVMTMEIIDKLTASVL